MEGWTKFTQCFGPDFTCATQVLQYQDESNAQVKHGRKLTSVPENLSRWPHKLTWIDGWSDLVCASHFVLLYDLYHRCCLLMSSCRWCWIEMKIERHIRAMMKVEDGSVNQTMVLSTKKRLRWLLNRDKDDELDYVMRSPLFLYFRSYSSLYCAWVVVLNYVWLLCMVAEKIHFELVRSDWRMLFVKSWWLLQRSEGDAMVDRSCKNSKCEDCIFMVNRENLPKWVLPVCCDTIEDDDENADMWVLLFFSIFLIPFLLFLFYFWFLTFARICRFCWYPVCVLKVENIVGSLMLLLLEVVGGFQFSCAMVRMESWGRLEVRFNGSYGCEVEGEEVKLQGFGDEGGFVTAGWRSGVVKSC